MNKKEFLAQIKNNLYTDYKTTLKEASTHQLHNALARTVMADIMPDWQKSEKRHAAKRRAYYLSAEFLMGRAVFNNLYCAGLLDTAKEVFSEQGININDFEDIEDAALGNGGLGRLAACFLDSAASQDIPLNGYGIRYRYGLFKQYFENGFQRETADKWLHQGIDAWSIRCENDKVRIDFADQSVMAVPYDVPIIGYDRKSINTLRLWQAEGLDEFNFTDFDNQLYLNASENAILAEAISNVLYPNDNTEKGLILRLKQQYFFCSASLQDIVANYKKKYGSDFSKFAELYSIQLNDTHPTVSIPELIRILMFKEGMGFNEAFDIAQKTFNYTNHTVMAEALEKWSVSLFRKVIPTIYDIIGLIDTKLKNDLKKMKKTDEEIGWISIIQGDRIHMANMAVFATSHTNGVAALHTEILKNDVLRDWYRIFPERFQNKTNGITPRRWLGLCNPQLSSLITEKLGTEDWVTNLDKLKELQKFVDDEETLKAFARIKREKKQEAVEYIGKHENFWINPGFMFDVQVKRLHEYKRQLLNAFAILDIYYQLKEGALTNWHPTVFIFGAKAAPAYRRAKGIIKFINEIAKKVNSDSQTNDKLLVLFVQNYNVSYAEKLIPAADLSEQISTAGLEASGTGNMKFMLNGAITIGTWDGANIEIAEEAGEQNEYIFGARVEEINHLKNGNYRPKEDYYYANDRLKRVINTLVDGTFNDGETGMFGELYSSLTNGFSWHAPDNYFICRDFDDYVNAKIRANREYNNDRTVFNKKCWMNICNAGKFSSDRTIKQYAEEIWKVI
ncbi:MAG: glycogen/starch/alpha-glucan phosphorylase [Oscillospiraceae bacterium]|nr:glycogen/starch/alpha-glucan phosphorylase [Oscillospiraceae bacterium]